MLRYALIATLVVYAGSGFGGTESGAWYFEMAPLQGSYGQVSTRAEMPVWSALSVAAELETLSYDGDRGDYRDAERSVGLEVVYYPKLTPAGHLFVGGGLGYSQMRAGRIERRNTQTWGRVTSDQLYDTWVDQSEYLLATQTLGYRVNLRRWFTVSLRLTSDQILRKTTVTKEVQVGDGETPVPRTREHSQQEIGVMMGLVIP